MSLYTSHARHMKEAGKALSPKTKTSVSTMSVRQKISVNYIEPCGTNRTLESNLRIEILTRVFLDSYNKIRVLLESYNKIQVQKALFTLFLYTKFIFFIFIYLNNKMTRLRFSCNTTDIA